MKLVAYQSQRAAEKEILEGLGFTVIEIMPARPSVRRTILLVLCQEHRRLR
jgi:hypothetical protein